MDGGVEADDDDMDIDSISHQRQRQPESGAASPEDVAAVAAAIAKLPPRPASTGPRPSMLSSLQTPKMGMSASSTTSLLSDVSSLAYRPLPTPAPPADRNEWHGMQVCWLKVRAGDPIGWQIDYDIYDHRSRYRATWNELVIGNPDADLPDSSDSSAVGDDGSTSSNDRDSSEDRSSDTGNDSDVSLPGIVTPCRRRSTADPGPVKLRNSISGDGMSVRRGPKRQYPHCDRSLPLPQRETTYPAGANETPLHLLGRRRHRRAVRWPVMIVARAPRGMPHLAAMLGPGETVPSPSLCPVPGTAEAEIAGDPSTWEYSVVKLPLGRHYAEWLVGGREGVREAAVLQAEAATGARDALPLMPTMDLYTFIASLAVASLASSPVGSGDINAFKTAADPALRVCNVPNQPDHVDLLVSGRPATSVGRPTFAPATVALHPDHVQPFVHGARPRDLRAWRAAPMAMPPRRAPLYMSAVVQATAIAASWEDIARIPVSAPSDLVPPPPLFPVAPPPTTASVAKHRTTLADAETQAAAGQAVVRIGTEVFRPGAHVWQIPMRIRTTKDNKLHKGAIKAAVTAAARAGHHTVRRLVVEADGGENGDADGLPPGLHPLVLGAYALGAASDDPVALPGGTRPPDRQIAVYTHNPLMSVSFASTTTGATGTAASTETASDLDAVLLTRMDPEAVTSVFSGYGPRGTRYRSLAHLATF
ncbi:hypothetical protein BC828DRAFT_373343 [Blastocladiella britannica]|nr:hypothetical protein BC828DRAFT_373343 [Blastocladiella britannica]